MKKKQYYVLGVTGTILVGIAIIILQLNIPQNTFPKPILSFVTPSQVPLDVRQVIVSEVPPTASQSAFLGMYPSQVLDLRNWKVTVPIGENEKPVEIKQPQLTKYKLDPWFVVVHDGNGVRFRAPVNSVTTDGSNYPRSELREMTNNGITKASWSSDVGTHMLFLDQAITATPQTKKHVVAGQIHDNSNDIIVIRLEQPNLYINVNGKNVYTLDKNYILGKRFTIKFLVANDQTKVFYNNNQNAVYTLNKKYSHAYFKSGAYTQSNCEKEKSVTLCNDNNYGEVIVYRVTVHHQ